MKTDDVAGAEGVVQIDVAGIKTVVSASHRSGSFGARKKELQANSLESCLRKSTTSFHLVLLLFPIFCSA